MLGTGVHDVRVTSHLQLGAAPVDGGQLSTLVHQRHPAGRAEARPLAEQPDQIPQEGGLPAPRRGEDQGTDGPPVLQQFRQDGQRRVLMDPRDTHSQGRDVPQSLVALRAGQSRSAQANPEAAGGGDIAPADGLGSGIAGILRGPVQDLLQIAPDDAGLGQGGLALRKCDVHGPPNPQAQFLRPGLVRQGQGHRGGLEPPGEQGAGLLVAGGGIFLRHHLILSFCGFSVFTL